MSTHSALSLTTNAVSLITDYLSASLSLSLSHPQLLIAFSVIVVMSDLSNLFPRLHSSTTS